MQEPTADNVKQPPDPWTEAIGRLNARLRAWLSPPPMEVYAFGKHPAWADFIDMSRLPPVPAAFEYFHRALRPALSQALGDEPRRLLAWREGPCCSVLLIQPSHDRGSGATGRFRRSPLFLGLSARHASSALVGAFALPRLVALADALQPAGLGADDVIGNISTAAADWASQFEGMLAAPAEAGDALTAAATAWWPEVQRLRWRRPFVLGVVPPPGKGRLKRRPIRVMGIEAVLELLSAPT